MSCTDCFKGCVETTSDKCVKYTGNNIEFLGISTGDSLEAVEKAITDYLSTVLSGLGILPVIDSHDLCTIVSQNFPQGDPTLVDILTAIIKAVCEIDTTLTAQTARIDTIEDDYTIGCLTGVSANSGTHPILQAVITTLCTAVGNITTLYNLLSLYVKISDINTYIQNYINSQAVSAIYTKMVPYVIYPFYPTPEILKSFSLTGAGFGAWEKIYFCNKQNGTPDLRGRSLIGVVSGMGPGSYDKEIDPAKGNEDYAKGDTNGQNSVSLTTPQIPAHSHVATVAINDLGHQSSIMFRTSNPGVQGGGASYEVESINENPYNTGGRAYTGKTSSELDKTGITATATNTNTGNGEGHDNVHPVYACYYIIYLP